MSTKHFKRLIIACDGTWLNSDNGFERDSWFSWSDKGSLAISSNVTRICRAILPEAKNGIQQIVYYQGGLGSQNSLYSWLIGGFFAAGLSENIREAYSFLCNNYEDGDEIFIVGFSRGAFTARSIGGLISSIGLLTRRGMSSFYPIFTDWENQNNTNYKPQYETGSWPLEGRPSYASGKYLQALVDRKLTRPNIPIKAVGVWDTAGSLGIPTMKVFGIPLVTHSSREYAFINTEVPSNVEYAFQALALDEQRTPFSPPLWEAPKTDVKPALKVLKQTWFPGVHKTIGGGYVDTSIPDLTLAWMITQLSPLLDFDVDYIMQQRQQNADYYVRNKLAVKSWALGLLQRSDVSFTDNLTGRTTRTPGDYHPTNPSTGKDEPRRLVNTCEFIHPSVRYRIEQKGVGLSSDPKKDPIGQGVYQPPALNNWTFKEAKHATSIGGKEWKDYGKWVIKRPNGETEFIPEEKIEEGTAQMALLRGWEGVEARLYHTSPGTG